MVELRPITEDNFIEAFNLRLAPGQEAFVSHPIRSLAQAYVYRNQCQPFGIYAEGRMVGYVMVIYDYDVPEYDIWHMMIDASAQGRGYGVCLVGQAGSRARALGCTLLEITLPRDEPHELRHAVRYGFLPVRATEDTMTYQLYIGYEKGYRLARFDEEWAVFRRQQQA